MNEIKNQVPNLAKTPLSLEEFYEAMSLVTTKEEMKILIKGLDDKLDEKVKGLDDKIADLRDRLERRLGNIEAQMMTKEDKEEIIDLLHHDTLENHEKRIVILER